jgi:hypothetical protein
MADVMRARMWLLALTVGCGPGKPPADPVTPEPVPPTPAVIPEPLGPPEVSQPEDLRALVRASNVERDWARLVRIVPQFKAFVAGLGVGPDAVLQRFVGMPLAKEVDLSRPVELAIYGEPNASAPNLTVALTVRDFALSQERIEAAFETTVGTRGSIRIRSARDDGDSESSQRNARCELHHAPGGSEGRLVCTHGARLDSRLAGYLAARQHAETNDQVTLDVTLTRGTCSELARTVEAEYRDFTEYERFSARTLLQFLSDLGSLGVELSLGEDDLGLELRLEIQSNESLLTSALLGSGEASPLPDAFWRLPAQSTFALWLQGIPPGARTAEILALAQDAAAVVPETVLDPAGREAAAQAEFRRMAAEGPMLFASGLDLDVVATEVDRFLKGSQNRAALQRLREHARSWTIRGAPHPVQERVAALRETIRVDREYSRVRTTDVRRARPARAPRGVGPGIPRLGYLRESPVPRRLGFPAGTVRFVHEWLANPEFVVRDGELPTTDSIDYIHLLEIDGYTWTCKAALEATCAPVLQQIAKGERTLADQPELQRLRETKGSLIGVTSAAGIISIILSSKSVSDVESAQSLLAGIATLPRGGTAPVVVKAAVSPADSGPGTLRIGTRVSHEQLLGWIGAVVASKTEDSDG